ncbi:organic cation transporter protein-like [Ostrea edulis]|uniref:organic cation transporter protein-like n=1 Tax=Ostrea edulis TaxID=37623 RepID=UPI0024AF3FEB|nr:organic cation transporter protein-like [Ostrea edulis]
MDPSTDVDQLWTSLGRFGKFQMSQLMIIWITYIAAGFQLLNVVFIGFRPSNKCAPVENVSTLSTSVPDGANLFVTYDKCSLNLYQNLTNGSLFLEEIDCPNGYSYSMAEDATFVTEFDLVCGRSGLTELTQTMTMAGQGIGAMLVSSLADRFGRKTVHICSHLAVYMLGFGIAFAPNYTVLLILRFIIGAVQQGLGMAGAVMALEWVPTNSRYVVEVVGLLFWSTGICLIAFISYLLQDFSWRYLQIAFTLLSSYSLIQYWIQEESVRWLLMNGKTKEAERIVRRAAKWNNMKYEDIIEKATRKSSEAEGMLNGETQKDGTIEMEKNDQETKMTMETRVSCENDQTAKPQTKDFVVEHYSILTILKTRRLLVNSMILWFSWIVITLTYYALTLTSTTLAGNKYLNFFLSGAVEYISCFVEVFMLQRIGRRPIIVVLHVITGAALVAATLLSHFSNGNTSMTTASVVFSLTGKMAITAAFSVIFLFTPELYPTNLRSVGIGFSSAMARIGSMLAPFAGLLALYNPWAPGTISAILCFVVAVIVLYLPETRGVELPTNLDALNAWYKANAGAKRFPRRKQEKLIK